MNSQEISARMEQIITEQRAILGKVNALGKDDLSGQEARKYQALENEWNELSSRRSRLLQGDPMEGSETRTENRGNRIFDKRSLEDYCKRYEDYRYNENGTSYRDVINRWIRHGKDGLSADEIRSTLMVSQDTKGGYTRPHEQFVAELIRSMNKEFHIRQFGRVFTMEKAEALTIPKLAARLTSVSRTTELKTGDLETLAFEQRKLYPKPAAGRMIVSNTMLRQSILDPEAVVRDEFLNAAGETFETEYMTGSSGGAGNEGLGIFTEDSMGIGSDRDVTTEATGAISIDDLHSVVGALAPRYRRKCRWIMGPGTEEYLKKRKDGQGQYLIQPDLTAGTPQRLLGYPLTINEFCPDSITSGEYILCLANLDYYWICDSLSAEVKRLDELYAEQDSTGFILRIESDSMPVLGEAFCRLKVK